MPIDVDALTSHTFEPSESSWNADDLILYALGIGAGRDPMDTDELRYVYEKDLQAVPSFGVIPVFASMAGLFAVPGMDINPAMILHGQQDLTVHGPIPTDAQVVNQPNVLGVWDKGKGALIEMEVVTSLKDSGEPIFTNVFGIFVRGEGGFGGESGPGVGNEAPDRDPDHVIERGTEPWQALLYRLSGDKNPLHADPEFSGAVGFERPILHGLCTYGIVCKAVIDEVLGGDPTKVGRYQVRFSRPVIPGQTIVVRAWDEGDTIILEASTKGDEGNVLSNAAITKA